MHSSGIENGLILPSILLALKLHLKGRTTAKKNEKIVYLLHVHKALFSRTILKLVHSAN